MAGQSGLVESTVGWAISWWIGPAPTRADYPVTASRIVGTVVFVMTLLRGIASAHWVAAGGCFVFGVLPNSGCIPDGGRLAAR